VSTKTNRFKIETTKDDGDITVLWGRWPSEEHPGVDGSLVMRRDGRALFQCRIPGTATLAVQMNHGRLLVEAGSPALGPGEQTVFDSDAPTAASNAGRDRCGTSRLNASRLSPAQHDALSVLATAGGRVEAGKRRTTRQPRAYVNQRAANSLVRLGLARCIDPDLERGYVLDSGVPRGMVCTYKYEATAEGREFHRLIDSDGSGKRAENALLKLMGFRHQTGLGLWLDPQRSRLDGGRAEALDEACATVEIEPALVDRVNQLVAERSEESDQSNRPRRPTQAQERTGKRRGS